MLKSFAATFSLFSLTTAAHAEELAQQAPRPDAAAPETATEGSPIIVTATRLATLLEQVRASIVPLERP